MRDRGVVSSAAAAGRRPGADLAAAAGEREMDETYGRAAARFNSFCFCTSSVEGLRLAAASRRSGQLVLARYDVLTWPPDVMPVDPLPPNDPTQGATEDTRTRSAWPLPLLPASRRRPAAGGAKIAIYLSIYLSYHSCAVVSPPLLCISPVRDTDTPIWEYHGFPKIRIRYG